MEVAKRQEVSVGYALQLFSRLAWRNLWRHRSRTWLLGLVTAYATLAMVCFWSFLDGVFESLAQSYAAVMAAPVRLAHPAWFEDPDPENALSGQELAQIAASLGDGYRLVPRLEFPALARSGEVSQGIMARGVDPALEPLVSGLPQKVVEGGWLAGPGQVVLGVGLARMLDTGLGGELKLYTMVGQEVSSRGFRVVGLVDSGLAPYDEALLLISLQEARALLQTTGATQVEVAAGRGREAAVARAIKPLLPLGVEVRPVEDLMGIMKTDMAYHRLVYQLMGWLIALLVTFAVTSTVWVSVLERTREFGLLAALGVAPRSLAGLVVLEAMFATALGALLGLVAAYGLIAYLATHNVLGPLLGLSGEYFSQYGLTQEIYTAVKPAYALYALGVVGLAGLLSMLLPARRVAQLEPVRSMRGG